MKRPPILAGICTALVAAGCSTRVSVEHEQTAKSSAERSTTIVEVGPLDSPPSVPSEPSPDPQPPYIDLEGIGNVIIFGDVQQHHHLHIHEAPAPPSVRVDVRIEVELMVEGDRRRRMVEQRIAELLERL